MKRHTFKPGDLVINSGRLLGQGYVWRVEEVWQHCPYDPADRRPWMSLKTITTLHGKPARDDYHIGGGMLIPCDYPDKQFWDGKQKPVYQERLL